MKGSYNPNGLHSMDTVTKRILLIEDEAKVARAIAEGLEAENYSVTTSRSGEDGFYLLCTGRFDLLLLDLMLPGRSGLEILSAVRRTGARVPVLVLTARDAVEDRVKGLDCGADDYMTKPFAFSELLARMRALLRRGGPERVPTLTCADLVLECMTRTCRRSGKEIPLTAREYELLEYLLRSSGGIVSREMLARDVWKVNERATPLDNVIDVHITRLRRKVDDPFDRKLLRTIRGVGFVLKE